MCPLGTVYHPCGPVCAPTCDGIGQDPEACCQTDYCVEGCYCPEGQYMYSKRDLLLLSSVSLSIDQLLNSHLNFIIFCVQMMNVWTLRNALANMEKSTMIQVVTWIMTANTGQYWIQ